MNALLTVLAAFGIAALVFRLLRALARAGFAFAEATAAAGLADVSQRRGDLTGLSERKGAERQARRSGRWDLLLVLIWLIALLLPLFTLWTRELYAAAALVWLLPRRSLQRRQIR